MKTGGTLNFLKRAGAILMLVAVFASSCNKYADDFKQLNTKLDGLASSIGGLSTLTADVASVKASVASALTAIAALPNAATHTAMQTSLTAVAASITTIQTNLAALTTTVNGLPKLADVNAIATKVAADLTIQLAKTQKAITDAMTTSDTKLTSAFTAAIAANNATLDALVKGDIAANNAKIVDAIVANNTAINAAIVANNKAISDAIVANNPAITAADAAAMVANNSAIAAEIVKNNPAIAALIAANNASVDQAIIGNNTAIQTLITAGLDALKLAMAGTSTDAVTAATINGLAAQLAAMKVTLSTIYNNTIKVVTVPTITGTAQVGMTLTANVGTALETGTWQWSNSAGPILDATSATYKVVAADLGKTIKVTITGTGSYFGPNATASTAVSAVTAAVTDMVALTGIANISGTVAVGSKLTAGSLQSGVPAANDASATATYAWLSSATQFGTYAPISGSGSAKTYTLAATDNTMWIKVVATGTNAYFNTVTSNAVGPVAATAILAPAITFITSNNFVTANLTNATFAATLTPGSFSFTGSGDPLNNWAGAFVKRVSDTQATIQLQGSNVFVDGTSNIIGVNANALATYGVGATVSAAASTVVALLPVMGTTISGFVVPVAGAVPVGSSALGVSFSSSKSISWSPSVSGNFLAGTVYTATITVVPDATHSLNGVLVNGFTVTGAVAGGATVTNSANSGVITVVCPVTSAVSPITLTAIPGITAPVTGTTPVTTITTAQYTGTVVWSSSAGTLATGALFAQGLTYTASITLTPTAGYSVYGVAANAYTVAGAQYSSNAANSQLVAATFPSTVPGVAISNAAIAGVTAPVKGAVAVTTITADPQFTGIVTWSPALAAGGTFAAATVYTATITLYPIDRIVTGVAANFFTVTGATATNAINAGVVSALFPVTAP